MIAFWPSIYNLNFSLPTNVRVYEKGTAEEFKKQASSVCIWIKKYLSWTNSPAKYEKAGWYALPFQQIPLFRCFCNNFFLVISDTQTSEQYPWLWKMSILELYILKIAFNVNVSLHISQLFLQKTGWLRIAPIFPQLEFYKFQVVMFSEKNTSLLLLIFSVKATLQ